jgi:hypothetical protein
MEIKEHFEDIRKVIIDNIIRSKKEIQIAMAWFTNHEIFNLLIEKAKEIPVHLIVINDDINNRPDGLNFQKFIDNGGNFYFGLPEYPMHNKYCIIDNKVLITGSYNYTYLAENINSENIIVFNGASDIIESYKVNFFELLRNNKSITSISEHLTNFPSQKDSFAFKNYGIRDIYAHIQELKQDGDLAQATSIIKNIEDLAEHANERNFIIKDVIYRQWKQDYYTDKIQVLDNTLILFFRTISDSGGCWVHGPNSNHAWTLRISNQNDILRKAIRITNIKVNGNRIITSTTSEEIFYFSHLDEIDGNTDLGYELNGNKQLIRNDGTIVPTKFFKIPTDVRYELSCEIHFDISEFPMETVDLIEGPIETAELNNHWHCFDINLRLNREQI